MYRVLKFFSFLVSHLGPLRAPFQMAAAHALAFLAFHLFRVRRRLVLDNLRKAFPTEYTEAERRRIAYRSIYNFALTTLEFFGSSRGDLADNVEIEGRQHIEKALEKGKGAFILCCHMGNWEALGAGFTRQITPARVVVKKVGSESVDRFVREMRAKNSFLCIQRTGRGSAIKAMIRTLRSNEVVGFVMDQARPLEPKIDFFGHPAKTNTALAGLVWDTKAPIIPGHIERLGVGHHRIRLGPEIELPMTEDRDADTIPISAIFNRQIEKVVRQRPEQYFWMHNRWKE